MTTNKARLILTALVIMAIVTAHWPQLSTVALTFGWIVIIAALVGTGRKRL